MFWERYRALCEEKGISPTAAGIALGVSGDAVSKWRHGSIPRKGTIEKVSDYFDCPITYLLGYSNDRYLHTQANEKAPHPEGQRAGSESPAMKAIRGMMEDMTEEELLHLRSIVSSIHSLRPREGREGIQAPPP